MLGLGESEEDVAQVMDGLIAARVDFPRISQYLAPSPLHSTCSCKKKKYIAQEHFDYLKEVAKLKGFKIVSSSGLQRSSYHAQEDFERLTNPSFQRYQPLDPLVRLPRSNC